MLAALFLFSKLGSVLAIAFFQKKKYSVPHLPSFFFWVLNFYLVWHLLRYPICFLLWITTWQVIVADILIWIYKNYVHFVMYFVIKDFELIKELNLFFCYLLELASESFWAWYPLKDGSRAVVLFSCHDRSWICSVFLFLCHF